MRAYRRRMSAGAACVTVELSWEDIELLISAKTLDPRSDLYTREMVSAALKEFLRLSRYA
jgi:hypothetical protein